MKIKILTTTLLVLFMTLSYSSILLGQSNLTALMSSEAITEFQIGFNLDIDKNRGVVRVHKNSAAWKTAVIRDGRGKTLYKFYREDIMRDTFKFSIAHFDSGHYFCEIRFDGGKKAVKTFHKFR